MTNCNLVSKHDLQINLESDIQDMPLNTIFSLRMVHETDMLVAKYQLCRTLYGFGVQAWLHRTTLVLHVRGLGFYLQHQ